MIKVYWVNHDYYSTQEFTTIEAAITHAKMVCFEAAFHLGDKVLGAWSPIGGYRSFEVS